MKKKDILDELKKLGAPTPASDATQEQLMGLLNEARAEAAKGTQTRAPGEGEEPPAGDSTPAPAPAPTPAPTPAPAPAADTELPSRRGPTREELDAVDTYRVTGQAINEGGVTYKKGETLELTLERAIAIGPELIAETD